MCLSIRMGITWPVTLGGTVRYRLPLLVMFVLCFVAISPAFGQWHDFKKWEVSPFVGSETSGSYPVTNSFPVDRLRVDSGLSFGTFIDYSLTENSQAEFMCMVRNSERKLRPFIAGGIGAAHESNSGVNPNRTLLAFNLGGGAKYEVSRHFALRGDLRWLPSRANKTLQVQCDAFGNCFQQNFSNYLQRVNFTGGIPFRF